MRPPFDPLRAAFQMLFFVIVVYALVILGMIGACIYHAEVIIKGQTEISCDPYNRLMSLMAAALSAALAFAGIRDRPPDDKDKRDKTP